MFRSNASSPRTRAAKSFNSGGIASSRVPPDASKYSRRRRGSQQPDAVVITKCLLTVLGLLSFFLIYIQLATVTSTSAHDAAEPNASLKIEGGGDGDGVGIMSEGAKEVVVHEEGDPNCTFREYVDRRYYGQRKNSKAGMCFYEYHIQCNNKQRFNFLMMMASYNLLSVLL